MSSDRPSLTNRAVVDSKEYPELDGMEVDDSGEDEPIYESYDVAPPIVEELEEPELVHPILDETEESPALEVQIEQSPAEPTEEVIPPEEPIEDVLPPEEPLEEQPESPPTPPTVQAEEPPTAETVLPDAPCLAPDFWDEILQTLMSVLPTIFDYMADLDYENECFKNIADCANADDAKETPGVDVVGEVMSAVGKFYHRYLSMPDLSIIALLTETENACPVQCTQQEERKHSCSAPNLRVTTNDQGTSMELRKSSSDEDIEKANDEDDENVWGNNQESQYASELARENKGEIGVVWNIENDTREENTEVELNGVELDNYNDVKVKAEPVEDDGSYVSDEVPSNLSDEIQNLAPQDEYTEEIPGEIVPPEFAKKIPNSSEIEENLADESLPDEFAKKKSNSSETEERIPDESVPNEFAKKMSNSSETEELIQVENVANKDSEDAPAAKVLDDSKGEVPITIDAEVAENVKEADPVNLEMGSDEFPQETAVDYDVQIPETVAETLPVVSEITEDVGPNISSLDETEDSGEVLEGSDEEEEASTELTKESEESQ